MSVDDDGAVELKMVENECGDEFFELSSCAWNRLYYCEDEECQRWGTQPRKCNYCKIPHNLE